MKKNLIFLILFFCSMAVRAQSVSQEYRLHQSQFLFIPEGMDTSSLKYIRTLQCPGGYDQEIALLFKLLKTEAKKLGANCFKLRSYVRNDSTKIMTLTLAVYFADDFQRKIIVNNQPSNVVYLFSDDQFSDRKISFQLNGDKIVIQSGYYYKYQLQLEEQVKISKGGFAGAAAKVEWQDEGPSRFFSVDGFGMVNAPALFFGLAGAALASATTGKIKEMDTNYGYLLTEVLQMQPSKIPDKM